jgi:hypothetical protein
MTLSFVLAFASAAVVEGAGYFFKFNKNLTAGVSTLIIMVGLLLAVTGTVSLLLVAIADLLSEHWLYRSPGL